MKQAKAFTLIELLIVMVIIATMVGIALPKYQRALERGRALEGVRNVQYAAEWANAKQMTTGAWPDETEIGNFRKTDLVKNRFFTAPSFANVGTVTISRAGGGWGYSLAATISEGALQSITCSNTGSEDVCTQLDMPPSVNLMTRN